MVMVQLVGTCGTTPELDAHTHTHTLKPRALTAFEIDCVLFGTIYWHKWGGGG